MMFLSYCHFLLKIHYSSKNEKGIEVNLRDILYCNPNAFKGFFATRDLTTIYNNNNSRGN